MPSLLQTPLLFLIGLALLPWTSAQHAPANPPTVGAISKEMLDGHFTAKDLIGSRVYGSDGENLAQVDDVILVRGVATRDDRVDLGRAAAIAAPETGIAAAMGPTPVHEPTPGSDVNAPAIGIQLVDAQSPLVVLSVGGVLGLGEKLVTIPLEALRQDPETGRIALGMTRAEFEASIGGGSDAPDTTASARAAGGAQPTPPQRGGRAEALADETLARDLSAQVDRIRRELNQNAVLAPASWKIDVTSDGAAIILSGTVGSQMDKERMLALVREMTRIAVIDHIIVEG